MTATASLLTSAPHGAAPRPYRVLVGLHEERPCPGAVAYQAIAAVTTTGTYRNPRLRQDGGGTVAKRSVALVLAEAGRQEDADAAHLRLLEGVAPLLAAGQAALPLAVELMRQWTLHDGHQVLAWSDGGQTHLLFQGDHRIICVHGERAALIRPSAPHGVGHCAMPLAAGDLLVLVAHATQAQLPLGTVAAMARAEPSPQALCLRATREAAARDPLSHHAALALGVRAADAA